jgi:hypothetical protein
MKQWITETQFNELTQDQKNIWKKWCRVHHYTYHETYGPFTEDTNITKDSLANFPSIGEMIEFLSEQEVSSRNLNDKIPANRLICDSKGNKVVLAWSDIELCDSLWEAVKEFLKSS